MSASDAQCILCSRPNAAEAQMVQCDGCYRWYHFSCAGVGDSITDADKSYRCALCTRRNSAASSSKSTTSTTASQREARLALEMQRLAEEKALQSKLMAEKLKQDQEMQEKALRLEKDRRDKAIADLMKLEQEFLNRKFKLLHAQLDEEDLSSVHSGRSDEADDNVQTWINNHQIIVSTKTGDSAPTGFTSGTVGLAETESAPGLTALETTCNKIPATETLSKSFENLIPPSSSSGPDQTADSGGRFIQSTPRAAAAPQPMTNWHESSKHQTHLACVASGGSAYPHVAAYATQGDSNAPRDIGHIGVARQEGSNNPYVTIATVVSTINSDVFARRTTCLSYSNSYIPSSNVILQGSTQQLRYADISMYVPPSRIGPTYSGDVIPPVSLNNFASQNSGVQSATISPVHTASNAWRNVHPVSNPHVVTVSSYQTPISAVPIPQSYQMPLPPLYGPNTQQLAARNVVPKELPSFSGSASEWPLFLSSFKTSTQMCGYNDAENLMRLQKCLKGDAKKAVNSFLLHPANVPDIINTLRVLYGRPEAIINCLLAEVRETPTPRPEKLESIISFGLAVRNLCAHLVSTGQQMHLANPVLIQELVEKLPANIKLDWALYAQRMNHVDLKTFADYMNVIISAASSVSSVTDDLHKKGKIYTVSNCEETTILIAAEASGSIGDDRPCAVCQMSGHKPAVCRSFKSKSLEDKWDVVQEARLCKCCLSLHGKWPCKASNCGIDGCQQRHHRLLHPGDPRIEQEQTTPVSSTISIHQQHRNVLLRIIPVVIHFGIRSVHTYALLDSGSDSTLIEKSLAQQLGVEDPASELCMQWTNGFIRKEEKSQKLELNISGTTSGTQFTLRNVQTVDNLSLPQQSICFKKFENAYHYLRGIPVQSYRGAVPGILIGLDNAKLETPLKICEGRESEPIAAKTRLGWVLYGNSGVIGSQQLATKTNVAADEQFISEELIETMSNTQVVSKGRSDLDENLDTHGGRKQQSTRKTNFLVRNFDYNKLNGAVRANVGRNMYSLRTHEAIRAGACWQHGSARSAPPVQPMTSMNRRTIIYRNTSD